jgi:hypothetical protein
MLGGLLLRARTVLAAACTCTPLPPASGPATAAGLPQAHHATPQCPLVQLLSRLIVWTYYV